MKKTNNIIKILVLFLFVILVTFFIFREFNVDLFNNDKHNTVQERDGADKGDGFDKNIIKDKHFQTEINGQVIYLEQALTPTEHYLGLSHRESLCEQCGMLFVFSNSIERTFVMREMNFSLDIVWLNGGEVIGLDENLEPEETPPYRLYDSPAPVDRVLELPSGGASRYNLKIGDKLLLP